MISIFRFISILLFSLLVSPLYAASFDCSKATTHSGKIICEESLPALDELASVVSNFVGLPLDLNSKQFDEATSTVISDDPFSEKIADQYAAAIKRLLTVIKFQDVEALSFLISQLQSWDVSLSKDKSILIIKPNGRLWNPEGILVYENKNGFPKFVNFETHVNAVQTRFNFDGKILKVSKESRHFGVYKKYRFQNGCWRLIGEDGLYTSAAMLDDSDIEEYSINYLTGKEINKFVNGNTATEINEIKISCLKN